MYHEDVGHSYCADHADGYTGWRCVDAAEHIEAHHDRSARTQGGCFIYPDGRHVWHFWNVLPDGHIVDVTKASESGTHDAMCGCGKDG